MRRWIVQFALSTLVEASIGVLTMPMRNDIVIMRQKSIVVVRPEIICFVHLLRARRSPPLWQHSKKN
jgi:hypothetical protein